MAAPRSAALVAAALILSLGLGACSSSKKSSTTGTTVSAGTIDIHNFAYQPSPDHAKVGQTITVTNLDGTDHSLTADKGTFDTGVFSSGSKTFVVNTPGTYTFHCRIHSFMHGTLVVTS
jgi:plastocyanin